MCCHILTLNDRSSVLRKFELLSAGWAVGTGQLLLDPTHNALSVKQMAALSFADLGVCMKLVKADDTTGELLLQLRLGIYHFLELFVIKLY